MLTIPKSMTREDLVVISRRKYDELLSRAKDAKKNTTKRDWIYEKPVAAYLRKRTALAQKELKEGKLTVWKKK